MKNPFGRKSQADRAESLPAPERNQKHQKQTQSTQTLSKAQASAKRSSTRPVAAIPEFIRPELPPHILLELRLACAMLLKETGPSDEDYAVHINQPDPLEIYKRDTQQIRDIREQASASQTSLQLFPKPKPSKQDPQALKDTPSAANKQTKRPSDTDRTAKASSNRLPEPSANPIYPPRKDSKYLVATHDYRQTTRKPVSSGRQHEPKPAPVELPNERSPKASHHTAPGKVEHRGTMGGARSETSSTQASALQRPKMSEKNSWAEPDTPTRKHLQEAKSTQIDPWASVNPDYTVVPTPHPSSQHPAFRSEQPERPRPERSESRQSAQVPSRPASRTGSIFENIRDGLRDYVKPRPSIAPTRAQSRSESRASSRPASRSSSFSTNGRNWLRSASNGLRRKSSFSSNRGAEEQDDARGRKDNRPDLNRSLPPLPGLDQYKEPKVHIAHLMAVTAPSQPRHATTSVEIRTTHADPLSSHSLLAQATAPKLNTRSLHIPPHMQHESPISPDSARSARSTSRPRIPFAEDDAPSDPSNPSSEPHEAPICAKEPRWLDMEVQRRINEQLSPALSAGREGQQPPRSASPGYFAYQRQEQHPQQQSQHSPPTKDAAIQREEAIRQIARRPLPHDRSDSYRSQNSEARSLSALGFRERQDQSVSSPLASRAPAKGEGLAQNQEEGRDAKGVEAGQTRGDGGGEHGGRASAMGLRRSETNGPEGGGTPQKKGLKNRLSRLLGGHGNQARAVVAN